MPKRQTRPGLGRLRPGSPPVKRAAKGAKPANPANPAKVTTPQPIVTPRPVSRRREHEPRERHRTTGQADPPSGQHPDNAAISFSSFPQRTEPPAIGCGQQLEDIQRMALLSADRTVRSWSPHTTAVHNLWIKL